MTPVAALKQDLTREHQTQYVTSGVAAVCLDDISQAPQPRRGLRSICIISLTLFAALNLFLSFSSIIEFDPYQFTYRGWAWWIFNDLRKHPEQHNVALLGSSLMVSAVNCCDANYLNTPLDLTTYHKASYLDGLLRTTFGGTFNTFNLSAPGQMPSDAYLSLKAMVNTADRPDVVIYGVAPRDFIDSTLSSPVDTEPFRYLRRLVNIDEVAGGLFRNPLTKFDFWLEKNVYLYGYSLDFMMSFKESAEHVVAFVLPKPYTNHPFTFWDRVRLLPKYLPAEIRPAAVISSPMDENSARAHFTDNTKEYLERYKNPDPHIYKTQFYFLRHLAAYCHREKIDLIIVNMPVTLDNVRLLKPPTYLNFVQALREFSYNNYVPAFDLSEFYRYERSDFHDPVHLNAFGAKKFFDRLMVILSGHEGCQVALSLSGQQLEKRQAVARSNRGGTI